MTDPRARRAPETARGRESAGAPEIVDGTGRPTPRPSERPARNGPPASSAGFFEGVAERYAAWYEERSAAGHALRERHERVLELLAEARGPVLDVGCGPGVLVRDLLEAGHEVWGLDAAPAMIAQGRKRCARAGCPRFVVGDAAKLPFRARSFRAVVCTGVIDRLPAYATAVEEMVRVLEGDAILLVSFPNLASPYAAWKRFVFYPGVDLLRRAACTLTGRARPASSGPSSRLHTARAATELVRRAGADVTDVVYFHFDVLLSPLDELAPRSALRLTRALERLRSSRLRWLGSGFIVRARKRA